MFFALEEETRVVSEALAADRLFSRVTWWLGLLAFIASATAAAVYLT